MNTGRHKLFLALSWLWLIAVVGYMAWATFAFEGLYRWLAEWQMAHWGQYYRKWTAALPILVMALPALAYLGHRGRLRRAGEAASPAAQARTIRRTAWIMVIIGLVGVGVGGGAFWLSRGQPDGTEKAERFDLARLGSGPVPQTKVRIEGRLDPAASTGLARGGVEDSITYYAGFRAESDGKDGPVRLFVERSTRPEDLTTLQAFLPEQTGYLIENGVPERALAELRARGVQVASPHYLLKTRAGSLREPYYVVAALSGFIGLICLLAGLAGFLQARRRAWLATAIRPDRSPAGGPEPL
jgi:hypothetical protein